MGTCIFRLAEWKGIVTGGGVLEWNGRDRWRRGRSDFGGLLIFSGLVHVTFDHGDRRRWILGERLGGEAHEMRNISAIQRCFQRSRNRRGEQGRLCERNELSGGGGVNGGKTAV